MGEKDDTNNIIVVLEGFSMMNSLLQEYILKVLKTLMDLKVMQEEHS